VLFLCLVPQAEHHDVRQEQCSTLRFRSATKKDHMRQLTELEAVIIANVEW